MPSAVSSFDPRTTLARPDLAEQALEGRVRADRYRAPRPMHGAVPVADIRAQADPASPRLDQLLTGEAFDVLDQVEGRLWGKARRDGVVGWIDAADLAEGAPRPAQMIARPDADLPLNALTGVPAPGAAPTGVFAVDPVTVAEALLGTPHELGARSSRATDCAGLVQQALYACGLPGPRYADQQAELGRPVDRAQADRGDLVIWLHPEGGPGWTGHAALMRDADTVIHATGHKGAVVAEAFAEADARYRADGFQAPMFRRL